MYYEILILANVTSIDVLNLLKSRILQSFLDCLIWAVVECSVMALKEKLFHIIGVTFCENFENIFNSK